MKQIPVQETIWICPYCSGNINNRQTLYEHLLLRHNMDTHYALELVTDMEANGSMAKATECISRNVEVINIVHINPLIDAQASP